MCVAFDTQTNTDIPIVVSEHNVEYEVYSEYVKKISFAARLPSWYGCRKAGNVRMDT